MQNNKITSATLAALVAQVIFGLSFMFAKIALNFASPMTVIADRCLVAFLFLNFANTHLPVAKTTVFLI